MSVDDSRVRAFHEEHLRGRPMSEIGREAGVTRERVRQWFEERGLPHGRELTEWRRGWKRLARAVARAAREPAHGTVERYRQFRCRCPACVAANTANAQSYHASRRGLSPYVCETCNLSVWKNKPDGAWRHFRAADHEPRPVLVGPTAPRGVSYRGRAKIGAVTTTFFRFRLDDQLHGLIRRVDDAAGRPVELARREVVHGNARWVGDGDLFRYWIDPGDVDLVEVSEEDARALMPDPHAPVAVTVPVEEDSA